MNRICSIVTALLLHVCTYGQASPTYFLSDKPANASMFIKKNGIKKEFVYAYTLIPNIWKKLIIKDSALTYTCTYDSAGNPLIRQRLVNRPVSNLKDSMVYNRSGQLMHMYQFSTFRGVQQKLSINDYSYDSAGNRTSLYCEVFLKDSVYKSLSRYVFNEKKQLIETYFTEKDSLRLSSNLYYNEKGDLIRRDYFKSDGQISNSQFYEYKHKRNRIVQSGSANGKRRNSQETEYNDQGQCVLISALYANPVRVSIFKYYPNGLFFEMEAIEYGHTKELSRHFYETK
ncbi:MAG: hypothetical protein V4450_06945 [Bacteroidota bacterium]